MGNQQLQLLGEFYGESHSLLTPSYAQQVADIFGFDCSGLVRHHKPSNDPKGYHGEAADGVAAFTLSKWLCGRLDLDYPDFYGRGKQHRDCCNALREFLVNGEDLSK